jgi:hypothetical protein
MPEFEKVDFQFRGQSDSVIWDFDLEGWEGRKVTFLNGMRLTFIQGPKGVLRNGKFHQTSLSNEF